MRNYYIFDEEEDLTFETWVSFGVVVVLGMMDALKVLLVGVVTFSFDGVFSSAFTTLPLSLFLLSGPDLLPSPKLYPDLILVLVLILVGCFSTFS